MFCTHVFIYLVIGKTARKIKTNRMKLTLCIFAVLVAICNLHFPDNSCEFIICRTPCCYMGYCFGDVFIEASIG
jgi:hypothetical protein